MTCEPRPIQRCAYRYTSAAYPYAPYTYGTPTEHSIARPEKQGGMPAKIAQRSPPLAAPQPVATSFGGAFGTAKIGCAKATKVPNVDCEHYGGANGSPNGTSVDSTGSVENDPALTGRRPSPWHDIAHSLSTTTQPPRSRRGSLPGSLGSTPPFTPHTPDSDAESQALRDWDRLLAAPDSDVTRHALVTPAPGGSPHIVPSTPKLAAERDKDGHIEYKLKLIEPSPERFGKLVTQMLWRLKQGKNEAIYELGLGDDGTVIGLTRAEMDASLQTLERMASDVGATVIVLKEIVLSPSLATPDSPGLSSSASSQSPWLARRPDLDRNGLPRRGTRCLVAAVPEVKTRSERRAAREKSTDGDSVCSGSSATFSASDDEPPPFHLDMEEQPISRAELKNRKAAARREQRRLDLLRGDGTSPMPYTSPSPSSSLVAEAIGHAPSTSVFPAGHRLPHQPARPSSLRLARTHSGLAEEQRRETATPDDAFIDGLALPLDSLSLSFADVTTVDDAPTAAASPEDHFLNAGDEDIICVEALVVRKPQNGEWGYDEAERWTFAGEDDGWGFGDDEE